MSLKSIFLTKEPDTCISPRTYTSKRLRLILAGILHIAIAGTVYAQPLQGSYAVQKNAALTEPDKSRYVDSAVWIPMPDGVRLSGELVYIRQQQVSLPVVLKVSCYPYEQNYERKRLKEIADSGYAALIVYNRGKEKSEGIFYPFEHDAADNYEVVDWISRQSWCNGNIGMYGGSYPGFAQWAAVKKPHPALKTIVPQAAVMPGFDFPVQHGVFSTYSLQWLKSVRNTRYNDTTELPGKERWNAIKNKYQLNGYAFNRLDSAAGRYDTVFRRWLEHPAADSYWRNMTPSEAEFARISIPVFTITGFFDSDQRGALSYYRQHHKYAGEKNAAAHYLFIGPFDHHSAQAAPLQKMVNGFSIDTVAAGVNQNSLIMQWFHYCLRGGALPAFLQNRVAVFVMGENRWHYFPSVDQMNTDTLTYYLQNKGLLSDQQKSGKPLELSYDTRNMAGDSLTIYNGGISRIEMLKKKQLLYLVSPPVKKDFIWNGSPVADLWISSSVPDADIELIWLELDSNGSMHEFSRVHQRLSHSDDKSNRMPWIKDELHHLQLDDAGWISTQVKKNNRIILVVQPLINNYYQVNYGSSKEVSTQTAADGGPVTLRIYTDSEHASRIMLPVM